jgi:hypothetical protein
MSMTVVERPQVSKGNFGGKACQLLEALSNSFRSTKHRLLRDSLTFVMSLPITDIDPFPNYCLRAPLLAAPVLFAI